MISSITHHLPSVKDRAEFLKYINNEHNWISQPLSYLFLEYGREVLEIEDFYRFIGRTMVAPRFDIVTAAEFFGISFIFRQVARLNPNFNSLIELEYDKGMSRRGHACLWFRSMLMPP